jgi:predicted alpha/beta superfamily hydrolase
MVEIFSKAGQEVRFHDPGFWSGFFHTYPALRLEGAIATPRTVHVFLPREYEIGEARYPVVYLNDGHTSFFPGGAYHKTWNLAGILTRLYVSQQIRKLIVVAVCPLDRDYEYTHAPVWNSKWGGLEAYGTYLARSLKEFIDREYRTLAAPEQTLVAGASHGGLAAFYTAVQFPEVFGRVAALSPSFWVGLDSAIEWSFAQSSGPFLGELQSSALMAIAQETLQAQMLQIYLDWGLVREGGSHNAWIEERATARGREMRDLLVRQYGYRLGQNLVVVEDSEGEHTEESWSRRMEGVFKLFFRS